MNPRRTRQWRALGTRVAIAFGASAVMATSVFAANHKISDDILDGTGIAEIDEANLAPKEFDDDPGDPTNFLIVGSDSRDDQGDGTGERFGELGGQRSDTIMVVHVVPREKTAVALSFPRDLIVDIPGMGEDKINSAFNSDRGGGPDVLIRTITENFGIPINHYLEVDFAGFEGIVNAVGYVPIFFPAPAVDYYTGLSVYNGCNRLDGTMALNYARSRHYRYLDFETNEWKSDPTADLGRIRRQQYFLRSLMQRALDRTARRPHKAYGLIDRLADLVTRDPALTVEDVKKLATAFINSDPAAIEMLTVPIQSGGGGLLVREEEAQPIFDLFALEIGPESDIDYGQYRVDVLNGGAPGGAAQTEMGELAALGFTRGRVDDTDRVARTEVRYSTEAGRTAAALLQFHLRGSAVLVEVDDLGTSADVALVLGPDFDPVDRSEATAPTTDADSPGQTTPDTTAPSPTTTPETTTTTFIAPNPGSPPDDWIGPVGDQRVGCSPIE